MPASPDSVMREWFQEVWNQGQEVAIDRLFDADGLAHGLPGASLRGPDAFKPLYRTFRGAFPNIRIDVVRTITEGEMVAAQLRVSGTHQGDHMGILATGRPTDFTGMCIAQVRNGKIIEAWNSFDFLTLYQQLGVAPQLM